MVGTRAASAASCAPVRPFAGSGSRRQGAPRRRAAVRPDPAQGSHGHGRGRCGAGRGWRRLVVSSDGHPASAPARETIRGKALQRLRRRQGSRLRAGGLGGDRLAGDLRRPPARCLHRSRPCAHGSRSGRGRRNLSHRLLRSRRVPARLSSLAELERPLGAPVVVSFGRRSRQHARGHRPRSRPRDSQIVLSVRPRAAGVARGRADVTHERVRRRSASSPPPRSGAMPPSRTAAARSSLSRLITADDRPAERSSHSPTGP